MVEQSTIDQLATFIQQRMASEGVTFVAIDGPSGAGKTMIAETLQNTSLAATVVHIDDFYSDVGTDPPGGLTPEEGYRQYLDWRRLSENVLDPLKNGDTCQYQVYDWIAGRLDAWVTVHPEGVLIIEGVYAMRPELRDYYDITVFVDTPRETRLSRLSGRPDDPVWVERWAGAEEWYNTNLRPIDYADVVVSGA